MSTVTFYPFFGTLNIHNLIYYAQQSSLTVTSFSGPIYDNNTNTVSYVIVVSQILSAGQQTTIQNIFNGLAYCKFT